MHSLRGESLTHLLNFSGDVNNCQFLPLKGLLYMYTTTKLFSSSPGVLLLTGLLYMYTTTKLFSSSPGVLSRAPVDFSARQVQLEHGRRRHHDHEHKAPFSGGKLRQLHKRGKHGAASSATAADELQLTAVWKFLRCRVQQWRFRE